MRRTLRRDFWMRWLLIFVVLISVLPMASIYGVSLKITIPITLTLWLIFCGIWLWFVDQLDPVIMAICKIFFKYDTDVIETPDTSRWCGENIKGCWFTFNGIYFFLRKYDMMAVKLRWLS